MRLLILIFLIALLPLRGWAGDAMALEMASTQFIAANNIATPADRTQANGVLYENSASVHSDCAGHLDATDGVAVAAPADADIKADGQCKTCVVCEMCHTIALTASVVTSAASSPQHLKRPLGGKLFASALPALRLKPPIS